MNNRLQKQARGLLEEIEVGDWVVFNETPWQLFSVISINSTSAILECKYGTNAGYVTDGLRLATPQELLDHGIIDEIPDTPRRLDLTPKAIDYLKNPRPLPQGDTILSGLIWLDLIYIVHSQPTKDGPVVHCRLTKKGREVVEMGDHDAH